MGIGTCYPCAKYLLLVLNLFFWVCKHNIYVVKANRCECKILTGVTTHLFLM